MEQNASLEQEPVLGTALNRLADLESNKLSLLVPKLARAMLISTRKPGLIYFFNGLKR